MGTSARFLIKEIIEVHCGGRTPALEGPWPGVGLSTPRRHSPSSTCNSGSAEVVPGGGDISNTPSPQLVPLRTSPAIVGRLSTALGRQRLSQAHLAGSRFPHPFLCAQTYLGPPVVEGADVHPKGGFDGDVTSQNPLALRSAWAAEKGAFGSARHWS